MTKTKFTKEDFVEFCKKVQNFSEYDYDKDELYETENGYQYNAEFRDQYNYRIPFEIVLEDKQISWIEPVFNDDEVEDTKPFFKDSVNELFEEFKQEKLQKKK